MPNKLKFIIQDKKIYTLKDRLYNKLTTPAHYKFIKIKDAPKSK